MTRARATALALVNWKGVFYERYQLDRHVTALEGTNGSGKTTVMIAAYVVLLPDMTRLRFTNLGESGATGGDRGIWGRLGQSGRPSYAVMEIELASGKSLVAAIHLERKSEPSVELIPLLISGLAPGERLRDVLLLREGDDESVPTLPELQASVERLGGQVDVFATAKDYFAALFDRGVSPLRMATDEDRNKYNDLLRTSMGGGISRALSNELRAFVLKEETGLGDALARMRQNVDTCHRTRVEVAEARRLEHEISGVYDAGQATFAAAVRVLRAEAQERTRRADDAREAEDRANKPLRLLADAIAEATARREGQVVLLDEARKAHQASLARCERTARALGLARRLEATATERASTVESVRIAKEAQLAADGARQTRAHARDRARDAYERAAEGLSNLQKGLEELHRNARARRHAREQLEHAREALGDPTLDPPGFDAALGRVRDRVAQIDAERARSDRDLESIVLRRDEYARATRALGQILEGASAARGSAHEEARRALAHLAELEAWPGRIPELAAECERTERLAERQRTVRERAAGLGLPRLLAVEDGAGSKALAAQHALAEAEAEVRAEDGAARAEDDRAAEAERTGRAAMARQADFERAVGRRRDAREIAIRIERAIGFRVDSAAAIARARGALSSEREEARAALAQRRQRREDLLRQAAALEGSADVDPELLRLRDEIDGELLAARYEDLDVNEAARLQAQLGPLADAIVVADPLATARKIAGQARALSSVWLVAADAAAPALGAAETGAGAREGVDLIVATEHSVRLTRIPAHPTLGRRAREQQAGELRAEAERILAADAGAIERLAFLDAIAREADALAGEANALEGEEPTEAAARAGAEASSAEAAGRAHLDAASAARQRATTARTRVDALRALFGDAFLLDPPDYAERTRSLRESLARAREAGRELRRVEGARSVLAHLVDALRAPPPADQDAAAIASAGAALDVERARLFRAREALAELVRDPRALNLPDVEVTLAAEASFLPALQAQLAQAREAVRAEEDALRVAEAAWERATRQAQKAEAEHAAIEAQHARMEAEMSAEGVTDPSDEALAAAQRTVAERAAEARVHERDERRLTTEIALLRERRTHAEETARAAAAYAAAEARAVGPAAASWTRMVEAAEAAGVLRDALGARFEPAYAGRTSAELRPEIAGRGEVLIDRLTAARGGGECIPQARAAASAGGSGSIEACLPAWLAVREWVGKRLPTELADSPEPLDALARLHDRLGRLEDHLGRQETDLRGVSGDVARGIDVQLRKASHQVRQLNQNLHGVTFGSIAGIRVQMRRIDRMDQVLVALREGAVQELLFQPTLPIEDALDEIFRRYGGGRTGGRRILDYREYVDLSVEIRRRKDGEWEPASSTRMSTGEAIGVGSALIMVVLTEWERNANLLRSNRGGSLRFLLLDEANRLSQDNLSVLFDLCRNLDVQLLIAAPEVARAEGNTTYRLVRRINAEGGEEVLVSGRRIVRADPAAQA